MASLPTPTVVLFVADVPRMAHFYQAVASMTLVSQDVSHAILELAGLELVIHALRGTPKALVGDDGSVRVREDAYVKVCLPVMSLATARSKAAELGGMLQPSAKEWQARGFRACDGHDPEGNVWQAREVAA